MQASREDTDVPFYNSEEYCTFTAFFSFLLGKASPHFVAVEIFASLDVSPLHTPIRCPPNNPGCANFASILRTVLFGAISTQNYYVSTLCVDIALTIRFANFA